MLVKNKGNKNVISPAQARPAVARYHRSGSRRSRGSGGKDLGAFHSRIVRQLWEINKILLSFIVNELAVCHVERERHRSSTIKNHRQDIPRHREHHNCEAFGSNQQQQQQEQKPDKQSSQVRQQQAVLTSHPAPEWSFKQCVHTVDKKLCFAATLCVDPAASSNANATVSQLNFSSSDDETDNRVQDTAEITLSDGYIVLLDKSFEVDLSERLPTPIIPVRPANQQCEHIAFSLGHNKRRSPYVYCDRTHDCEDSIVFQRSLLVGRSRGRPVLGQKKLPKQKHQQKHQRKKHQARCWRHQQEMADSLEQLKRRIRAIKRSQQSAGGRRRHCTVLSKQT